MPARGLMRLVLALFVAGCVVPRPTASLASRENTAYVAVISGEMPPPIDLVARHAWIIVHIPGETDRRFEYAAASGSGPFDDFTGGDVMLHGVVSGSPAEITKKLRCLEGASREARRRYPHYFPIPGPNSNTYIDVLLRECAIAIELPDTAIGRDYRGIIGASITESRTGIQLESVLFGLRLGLVDGIEVHLLSFVLGVHFWPPGITVPVNPGRIGFATDGHVSREHEIDRHHGRRNDGAVDRQYGLASAWVEANIARPIDPAHMGGLEGRAAVGVVVRALYGKRVGYGFGLDFDLGGGVPASFAYSMHLLPLGVGVMFGPTGYIGLFAGVGTSGVTTLVEPAVELPIEARLEMDVTKHARIGFRGAVSWNVGTSLRQLEELTVGAFARFGKTRRYDHQGFVGSGYFIGFERRELMGSAWLGLSFGVESDAAW
jgi:hypothetical protein